MSALRSVRNLTASTSRALALSSKRGFASASAVPRSMVLAGRASQVQAKWAAPTTVASVRGFSYSARAMGEGASDGELVGKLKEELTYEREAAQSGVPDFVKELTQQGVWTIDDVSGNDEVTFIRSFGNEQIRMMFSIADLDAAPETEYDVEGETAEGEPAEETITSVPIRVAISVTKPGTQGALNVDAVCQDGAFLVENVSFYPDAKTGTELTAEADWKRRGLYLGPTFENLDPGVQDEFEKFLDERGINESLALFIPDYAEYKEQTEYVRWLEGVKKFIEN
ncbi:hypothetical protein M0805_002227 [Coniferiporia weirii]|nr:hypothetical protein M0805_002227 [Coniferiporia weirii]